MTALNTESSKLIGLLEWFKDKELTEDDWLTLGRLDSAIRSFAMAHNHSLNPLTGSNLLKVGDS